MTDSDENLLSIAKLAEAVDGDLDDPRLFDHAGAVPDRHEQSLSFCADAVDGWSESDLSGLIERDMATRTAHRAVTEGSASLAAYLTGVTEQDLDASALTLSLRLADELERDGVLTTLLAAGEPNTGKTNTVSLIAELSKQIWDDLLIVSNVRSWELSDVVVTNAHDLTVTLLENRDRPIFVLVDEGSTHFDNRTHSYDVASQWSPLHKRMSKLSVEVVAVIGHTGKDVDPEAKRLSNLAFWKEEPDVVDFYSDWPADSDRPANQLFGGSLESLEATSASYDPDDAAPWKWNLRAGLFEDDLDWSDLLVELRDRGPAD